MTRSVYEVGLLLVMVLGAGCVSSSPDARKRHLHAGLSDSEILTLEAVIHWYDHYRNSKFSYRFDERDGAFSQAVMERLAAEIFELRPDDNSAWLYVSVPKIAFPEASFGYAEVFITDPFYAERYVEVFEKKAGSWQIIDSITIATGIPDAFVTEFDWPSYFRDMMKKPNQSPEPTALLVTPRAEARVAPSNAVAHL